jgi:hypothetical protein
MTKQPGWTKMMHVEFEKGKMLKAQRLERARAQHDKFMAARARYREAKRLREELEPRPPTDRTPPE